MAEWIAEALLSQQWPPSCEQVTVGIAGLIKIGDIVSDCFFVNSLVHFQETFAPFLGIEAPNVTVFIACAAVFTAIGIIFDLYKAYLVVMEYKGGGTSNVPWCEAIAKGLSRHCCRCRKSTGDDDMESRAEFKWWKRSNLIFEEIPQLIILVAFYLSVRGVLVSCDIIRDEFQECSDTYGLPPTPSPSSLFSDTYGFSPTPGPSSLFGRYLEVASGGPFDEDVVEILRREKGAPTNNRNGIPKVIIQTSPNRTLFDPNWPLFRQSLVEMNPDFTFLHFDDEDAVKFINENFEGTLLPELYRKLPRSVMKADIFRLAAVLVLGGFYMDCDMVARQPFGPLVSSGYGAIFPKEWQQDGVQFEARHFRPPSDPSELWQVGNYAFAAAPWHDLVLDSLSEAVARCIKLVSYSGSAHVTDLDVLQTTGPYMLSEVYHEGRKKGKYEDVYHMQGDSSEPLRHRGYGHNDWHKFGPFAEHMLSHSWTNHELSRGLQEDFYSPTSSPVQDFSAGTSQECDTVFRLIEQCNDGQTQAQVGLEEAQSDLYISSILSTVFTCLTMLGVVIVWCRDSRADEQSETGAQQPVQKPVHSANSSPFPVPSANPSSFAVPPTTPSSFAAPPAGPSSFAVPPSVGAPASYGNGQVRVETTFCGLLLDCSSARTRTLGLSVVKHDDGRFYVQQVKEGGAAAAEGTIQAGDIVVAVNDKNIEATWPLERVVQTIKSAVADNPQVTLDVKRVTYQETFANEL